MNSYENVKRRWQEPCYLTRTWGREPLNNKPMKPSQIWVLGAVVALGLACNANANVIVDLGEFSVSNQNPATVLAAANADGVDSGVLPDDMDLLSGGRITGATGGTLTNSFGTFTLTVNSSTNIGVLTFTINSGFVLAGIGVHAGGGSVDRFFSINDETSGTDEGPFFGHVKNGMAQGFSNFDIFVETALTRVPDGGPTVMLLGAGLAGIGLVGRRLKR